TPGRHRWREDRPRRARTHHDGREPDACDPADHRLRRAHQRRPPRTCDAPRRRLRAPLRRRRTREPGCRGRLVRQPRTVAALILHPIAAGGRPTALHLAAIDWGTLVVEDVPASNAAVNVSVPEGQPLVLRARVLGGTPGTVRVTMLVAGRRRTRTFTAVAAPAEAVDLLPVLWASDAVRALWPDRDAMRDLALRYGVLSSVTALVAIDATAPSE